MKKQCQSYHHSVSSAPCSSLDTHWNITRGNFVKRGESILFRVSDLIMLRLAALFCCWSGRLWKNAGVFGVKDTPGIYPGLFCPLFVDDWRNAMSFFHFSTRTGWIGYKGSCENEFVEELLRLVSRCHGDWSCDYWEGWNLQRDVNFLINNHLNWQVFYVFESSHIACFVLVSTFCK